MRQAMNEAVSVASLMVSAFFGVIGAWGCPNARWLHWITLGFLLLGSAFGGIALWLARWRKPKGYTKIAHQPYVNCDVLLDGYAYLACTFINVTFVYNGGDAGGFDGQCRFGGAQGFKTGDPKLGQMLGFLKEIKMLRSGAVAIYTPKRKS